MKCINSQITNTANKVFNNSIKNKPTGNLLKSTKLLICFKSGFPSLFKSNDNKGSKNDCENELTNLSTLPAINQVNAVEITVYFIKNSFKLFACFILLIIYKKKIKSKKKDIKD